MKIEKFKGQELLEQINPALFVQYYSKLTVPEGARIIFISKEDFERFAIASSEVSGTSKAGKPWNNTKHSAIVEVGEVSVRLSWMGKDPASCVETHFVCWEDIKS